MRVTAIGAKGLVAFPHGHAKARSDRLLPDRQMARPLNQVLQKEVEGALFAVADFNLKAEQLQTPIKPYVVVRKAVVWRRRILYGGHIGRFLPNVVANGNCQRTTPPRPKKFSKWRFRKRVPRNLSDL